MKQITMPLEEFEYSKKREFALGLDRGRIEAIEMLNHQMIDPKTRDHFIFNSESVKKKYQTILEKLRKP